MYQFVFGLLGIIFGVYSKWWIFEWNVWNESKKRVGQSIDWQKKEMRI